MAHPLQQNSSLNSFAATPPPRLAAAEALAALGRDHGMAYWRADADLYAVWARVRLHDPEAAAALPAWQGARSRRWFSKALLAEHELHTHGVDTALWRALTRRWPSHAKLNVVPISHSHISCAATFY